MKLAWNPLAIAVSATLLTSISAQAEIAGDHLDALLEAQEIPVTVDSFIRAATDIEFDKYVALAGGVNRFYHFRDMMPVDAQTTISANRDTLYSAAIVNISESATLTLPDVGDRYMSAMVINQDHYLNEVFHGGGTYALNMDTFHTPFVAVYLRVLLDATDPEDLAAVHAIQDQMSIEAASSEPFVVPPYDEESYKGLVKAAVGVGAYLPDSFRMFGKKEDVDPVRHFIGTAGGWGGLPEEEALYLGIAPNLPVGEYKIEVPGDVPVKDFWSVSVYDADRYFAPNAMGAYVVNSVMGERNADGSMTVHMGGCEDGRVNCLPLVEGWQYTVRLYRAAPEVLDGSWTFPGVEPVN
ncbi:DUF1214 domain-containing protein [Tropicimonas isoalkanivorans]|uniref:DUF1214 domain-containing protein n=1 Tax=Tropicimonas isoalkanivorans TaxID=441112 RepID=A0A1I1MLT7_9RHOB|nr:DUF1214 domain-containing protein [Tropicimonas isoalkanivorans]SFC86417.1 Protein of unknown function [Tropicimonas isoalkanivorans]